MGKGAGLESTGWGALGANDGVKYGATWTSYMPADAAQMNADAPLRRVEKAAVVTSVVEDWDHVGVTGGEMPVLAKKSSAACTIL
jgi:hypothetical protein